MWLQHMGGIGRTVCNGAVVGFFEEAISGEGVADAGVLRLGETVVDGVIEALSQQLALWYCCCVV
jgi:hypothetical protein